MGLRAQGLVTVHLYKRAAESESTIAQLRMFPKP